MNKSIKKAVSTACSLLLVAGISMSAANAQQTVFNGPIDNYTVDNEPLDQAQLDQVLAPIALYPDSLLSHILVASTYPLEVVQANRWRQANQNLTEAQVISAVEDKEWDPSVKALTPFTDLLFRLSDDLDWLQTLGDSFLQNENQVLASVQYLRKKAYDKGSLANNDYYSVQRDNGNIIIEPNDREIVYVPYYDSRVVYGPWWRSGYEPVFWSRPRYARLHAGFYWSDRFYIRPTLFFGGFHWSSRNLVVNHHYYNRSSRIDRRYRNLGVSDYRRWNHNPKHRRGARYSRNDNSRYNNRSRYNSKPQSNRYSRDSARSERRNNHRIANNNRRSVQNRIKNQNRGKDNSADRQRNQNQTVKNNGRTRTYNTITNRNKANNQRTNKSNANKSSNRYSRTSAVSNKKSQVTKSSRNYQKQQTSNNNTKTQKSNKSSRSKAYSRIKSSKSSKGNGKRNSR